jgi:hypothetical protein
MPENGEYQAITCLKCGGALDFREGERNILCKSCKTMFAATGEAGITRFYLEDKLKFPEARSAARKFIATGGVDEGIAKSLHFQSSELCFLPFWRLIGYAIGWRWMEKETIIKEQEVDENGRTYEVEKRGANEVTFDTVATRVDFSSPACELSSYGLRGIATVSAVLPLKGICYESLARRSTVFDPVKPPEQVRKEALALAKSGLKEKDMLRMENELALCDERLELISYPVWKLSFTLQDRIYPVVVDGINGNILKARFPGRSKIRLFAPMFTMTLAASLLAFNLLLGSLAAVILFYYLACLEKARRSGAALDDLLGVWSEGPSWDGLMMFLFRLIERGKEVEHG